MKSWIRALLMTMSLLISLPASANALKLHLDMPPVPQQATNGITILLTVTDQRPSSIPGLTVDGDALRITNDLPELIRQAVSTALQQKGYQLVDGKQAARRTLHIELATLSYQAEKKFLRSQIHVEVVLRAIVTHGRHTLNKSFHGKNAYEVALSPSDTENSRMLSETIAHALDSMLNDVEIDQALR